jgi:hypothetical protein
MGCRGVLMDWIFRRNGRWKRVARPARLRLVALVARRSRGEHFDYKRVKGMGI